MSITAFNLVESTENLAVESIFRSIWSVEDPADTWTVSEIPSGVSVFWNVVKRIDASTTSLDITELHTFYSSFVSDVSAFVFDTAADLVGSIDFTLPHPNHAPVEQFKENGNVSIQVGDRHADQTVYISNKSRNKTGLPVTTLSGYWKNHPTTGYDVSGTVDFDNGIITYDFHNIEVPSLFPGGSAAKFSYEGNYGDVVWDASNWSTSGIYLTAGSITVSADFDTLSYNIGASAYTPALLLEAEYEPKGFTAIYDPPNIKINEVNYNYENVQLSAVVDTGETELSLFDRSLLFDTNNQYYLMWEADPIDNALSAIFLNEPSTPVHSFNKVLSGFVPGTRSLSAEDIRIFSSLPLSSRTYSISAYLSDVANYPNAIPGRVVDTYNFNYYDVKNDTLAIALVSSNVIDNDIIHLQRLVETWDSGTFTDAPTSSVSWAESNSTLISAKSGIQTNDFNNTEYYGDVIPPPASEPGFLIEQNNYNFIPAGAITVSAITSVDLVYGLEYLNVAFPLGTNTNYYLTGSYTSTPTISVEYFWKEYISPTDIGIIQTLENEPFIRKATFTTLDYTSVPAGEPLHYNSGVVWEIDSPSEGGIISIYDGNGDIYLQGVGKVTTDTITVYVSTDYFDNHPVTATDVTFTVNASVYDVRTASSIFELSTATDLIVDTFPATSLFDAAFTFNNELPGTSDVWRLVSNPYTVSATIFDTSSGTFLSGENKSLTVFSTAYDDSVIADFTVSQNISAISYVRSNVFGTTWLSAHTVSATPLDVHFRDAWPSAEFIIYPQYYWNGSAFVELTEGNHTLSPGACAYNHGHIETFTLSAQNIAANFYEWEIENETISSLVSTTVDIKGNTDLTGIPVCLSVYDDDLPTTMPGRYYDDVTGDLTLYPNICNCTISGDFSDPLHQSIRFAEYDSPTFTVDSYANDLLVPVTNQSLLTASRTITFPANSPVDSYIGSTVWTVSAKDWSGPYTQSNEVLSLVLSAGNGVEPGTIRLGEVQNIDVFADTNIGRYIPHTPPSDWAIVYSDVQSDTVSVTVSTVPNIELYTSRLFYTTGETIEFQNITIDSPPGLLSAFIWDDNVYDALKIESFGSYITSYINEGSITINVQGVLTNGFVYDTTFTDVINIQIPDVFDPDIVRVFGTIEVALPHLSNACILPPNEWITADNLNVVLQHHLDNIEYIRDISKYYAPPPNGYDGWLGSTLDFGVTNYGWNLNIPQLDTNYNNLSAALDVETLSAVNDVALGSDGTLYVADGSTVQILLSGYSGSVVSTVDERAIGDKFGTLAAIDIDTDNRVYLLDSENYRVIVMQYTESASQQWKALYTWGALGNIALEEGFQTPSDLEIDASNFVWVSDSTNNAIKKFSRTGSFVHAFTSDLFSDVKQPLSVTVNSGLVYVLTQESIIEFDESGNFQTEYELPTEGTPKRITNNGEFLYLVYSDKLMKMTLQGKNAGIFGDSINGEISYTGLDFLNSQLFVSNINSVLRFDESLNVIAAYVSSEYDWSTDDIYVDKDEYIQPWVVNRVLARLWDNVELIRRGLLGSVEFDTISNNVSGYVIKDFTPTEYNSMQLNDKGEIFVGINEIVSYDVLNRCLTQLYNYEKHILSFL
jgi:hypothetical protein